MPTIEIPCNLGDVVYHIHEIKYRGKDRHFAYPICESVVSAVHIGRKLKFNRVSEKSDSYIRLTSVATGYMSQRIPFERFTMDCFYSYAEAKTEVERRIADENTP